MGHPKAICKNTLIVANAYLPSYILNNVNVLITFIVHYFLKLYTNFFFVYRPWFARRVGGGSPTPLG